MKRFEPNSNLGHAFIGYIMGLIIVGFVFIGLDYLMAPVGMFLMDLAYSLAGN